jgi:hypothetical protein
MSRIRIIMLSLLAVFAVSAVASASASAAEPEWVACAKVAAGEPSSWSAGCTEKKASGGFAKVFFTTGTCAKVAVATEPSAWENSTCTKAKVGTGEFIKIEALKRKFTSISEPSYLFGTPPLKIRCGKDTDVGEINGAKTVGAVKVIFKECEGVGANEETCPVKSVGAANAGEIVTEELVGELGLVAAAEAPSSETGLALKPAAGVGKPFVKLIGTPTTCIPETNVTGSVIGEVEPVKTMDTTGELIFGVKGGESKKNKQTIQKLVGDEKDTLEAFGAIAGFESEDSITYTEAFGWEVT